MKAINIYINETIINKDLTLDDLANSEFFIFGVLGNLKSYIESLYGLQQQLYDSGCYLGNKCVEYDYQGHTGTIFVATKETIISLLEAANICKNARYIWNVLVICIPEYKYNSMNDLINNIHNKIKFEDKSYTIISQEEEIYNWLFN